MLCAVKLCLLLTNLCDGRYLDSDLNHIACEKILLLCFDVPLLQYEPSYLLTPCSRVLLEKLTGFQPVKKIPHILWNQEGSLPYSQVPATCPYPIPLDPVHTHTSYFLKIHLNITHPSMFGSPKLSLSFRLPHQNSVYASPLPHTRYMPRPSHSSRFYHPDNIG